MNSSAVRVLSVIPPMTQLNTPYPSTAYLTGFLRSRGVDAVQEDLALQLVRKIFSQAGLGQVAAQIPPLKKTDRSRPASKFFLSELPRYLSTIDRVIAFLQGRDATLAHRIVSRQYLPEGPRFASLDAYIDEEGVTPSAGRSVL